MMEAATRAFQPASLISPSPRATEPRMKLNSPTCEKAAPTGMAVARGLPRTRTVSRAARGLPITTTASTTPITSGVCTRLRGIEQHADRDEEEHGKGVAHRHRVAGGPGRELRAADGQSGEKRPERHRHPEDRGGTDRNPHGENQHRQREQLARAGLLDPLQRPGDHPPAQHHHDGDQARDLERGQAEHGPGALAAAPVREQRGWAAAAAWPP